MRRLFPICIALILTLFPMLVHAQDGTDPIEAPDSYIVELLGIPRTEASQFTVTYDFEGVDEDDESVAVSLVNQVAIQPDPPAYHSQAQATGDLLLFDMINTDTAQTEIESELVYLRRNLYTYVHFPTTQQTSCGKNVSGSTPAINRLSAQLPFPSNTFQELPPLPRVYPDAEFGEQQVARYALDDFSSFGIEQGTIELHLIPADNRVVYFTFEGNGQFYANETLVEGNLRYTYTTIPGPITYDFHKPTACEAPNVQDVAIFEPSVEWITREDTGFYLTNQTLETLIAFHQETLDTAGFEAVGEPYYDLGSVTLTYISPDSAIVEITLYDGFDGTQVEISIRP